MLTDFRQIVRDAANGDHAIAGFNVFGYEDVVSVVAAAEELNVPVIVMTNKLAVESMPVESWGYIINRIAEQAKVPVCIHLDHTKDIDLIKRAIKSGYTSVMFDGSQLPFEENIDKTRKVAELAYSKGVIVEAEIGSVAYTDTSVKTPGIYTDPNEAEAFAEQTGLDWLAVAIGTIHRMQTKGVNIRYDLLEEIGSRVKTPLVIHGSSGLTDFDLRKISKYNVGKFNIGTTLRMAFVNALHDEIIKEPREYDRPLLFRKPMMAVQEEAKRMLLLLGA